MQSQSPESIPPECNEDVELIERFQQGDTAAFDLLFTRYQKRTYRLVQRFVPNPEDASDLTQDAFYTRISRVRRLQESVSVLQLALPNHGKSLYRFPTKKSEIGSTPV